MLLRGRLFSLAFLSFLIFSPLSEVIDIANSEDDGYSYAVEELENLEPKPIVSNLKSIGINNLLPPSVTNLYMTGAMEQRATLTINYTYVPNPDPESGTTFQWFTYDDQFGSSKTIIPGATASTITLDEAPFGLPANFFLNKHLSVEVTPRDNMGATGATVEFRPWDGVLGNDNAIIGWIRSCNNASGVGAPTPGNILTPNLNVCSPRMVSWEVSYVGIDYDYLATLPVIFIDWGDGLIERLDPTLINANPPTTLAEEISLVKQSLQEWQVTANHTYDYGGASLPPVDGSCTYELIAYFGLKNIVGNATNRECRNADQSQFLAVWDDISNTDLGTHDINHDPGSAGVEIGETVEVCAGDNSAVRLLDASTFNCVPTANGGNEDVNNNDQSRWIQWIYGSTSNITTGVPVTEKIIINGVSYDAADLPVYGTPTIQAPAVTNPNAITDDIQMPTSALVGEIFEVTMRSWNTCNPFNSLANDLNPTQVVPILQVFEINTLPNGTVRTEQAGLNAITGGAVFWAHGTPILRTYDILIAPKPIDPVAVAKDACNGSALPNFQIIAAGNVAVEWFEDNAGVPGPLIANSLGVNSLQLPTNDFEPGGAINNTTAGTYLVWARYSSNTGTQNCWSDPVQISLDVRELLVTPASVSSTEGAPGFTVCADNANITFTVDDGPPGTGTPGGAWEYNWFFGGGTLNDDISYVTPDGLQSRTVSINLNSTSGLRRVRVRRRYTTNATVGGRCNSGIRNFNFTIDPVSVGGTLSPANTICLGDNTGNITLNGNTGPIQFWEVNVNTGGFVPDVSLGTANPINPIPAVAGTHVYRATVQSGVCASTQSSTVTVTVNPIPGVPSITPLGPIVICDDASQVLTVVSANAATYQWFLDGIAIVGATGTTYTANDPSHTGIYTVLTLGIGPTVCPSLISNSVDVTVNALPTADVTGGGSICAGTPAPDVVFTFTGAGPWDLIYAQDGVPQPVENNVASPFAIVNPAGNGAGIVYTIVSIVDNNTPACLVTAPDPNITGSATVTVIATPPPTVEFFTATAEVCDDGGGTNPPDAILDLLPDLVQNYDISYTVNGVPFTELNLPSDAAGILTLSPPYTAWGSMPGSYVVTVTALTNTGTLCAGAVPFDSDPLVVNPRPAIPTTPVAAIACSSDLTGATITVDDPGAGFLIQWFTDMAGTIAAVGATGGTRQETFTPTSNATVTYYAFTESTTVPTLCLSAAGVLVQHTQDLEPTSAANFPDFNTCNTSEMLTATPASNGGTGLWTIGASVYYESFPSADNGLGIRDPNPHAVSFIHPNSNWSVTVANANVFSSGNDWIMVDNGRMSARDVNNTEVVWRSEVVILAGSADISADIAEFGNQGAGDFIRVFYRINGGPEVPFGAINDDGVDGVFQTETAAGIGAAGNTLEIVMRARNNGAADEHWLDNVIVSAAGSALPIFDDANSPTATVSNLPLGATTFTWTITSALGACAATNDMVTILRNALPVAVDPSPELCEDTFGSADANVTPAFLLTLDATVNGGNPLHTVEYFSLASRLPIDLIVAPFVVNTLDQVFTRVTRTDVAPQCTLDGVVTFTVDPRPVANSQVFLVCEETVGSANVDNQNFPALFNDGVIGNPPVAPADRTVVWYFDPGAPITIAEDLLAFPGSIIPGGAADVDGITDGQIFYALVEDITPANSNCLNFATIEYDVVPRPIANPITGQATVCVSGNAILYQVSNVIPGTQYNWNLPPDNPGIFLVFGGGGINDFFVLLQFPGLVAPPVSDVYNISVTETSPGPDFCVGDPQNFMITVEDSPSANPILGPDPVCKDEKGVVYQVTVNNPANTYSWSITAGDAAIQGASSGLGLNQVIVDFNSAALITLEVTETSPTGCSLPAAQFININAVDPPVMTSAINYSLCSGEAPATAPVPFVFTAAPGANTFAWEAVSVPGSVAGVVLNETGVGDIVNVLTNTSGLDAIVTFEVTPTGVAAPNCVGVAQTVFITVQPEPTLVIGQNTTVCGGTAIGYEILLAPANLPALTVFNWPDPDGAGPASDGVNVAMGIAGTTHINDIIPNVTGAPIIITYMISPTSGSGCDGPIQNVVVTVDPQPIIAAAQVKTICSGDNVDYHVSLLPAGLPLNTEYDWAAPTMSAGGPQGSPGVNVPEANALTITDVLINTTGADITATYSLTPTVTTGANCTILPAVDVVITIEPEPTIAAGQIKTICSGDNVDYKVNLLPAGLPANTEFSWPLPTMSAGPAQGTVGVGVPEANALTITDILTNTTGATITATYSITATVNGGLNCSVLTPVDVVITIEPQPVIVAAQTKTICSGSAVDYDVILIPAGLPLNTVFNWAVPTMSDASVQGSAGVNVPEPNALTITDVLNNTTGASITATYNITPIVGSGLNCTTLPAVAVVITIEPEPTIVAGQTNTICSGSNVDYHVSLLPAGLPANTVYDWPLPTMSDASVQGTAGVAVPEANALTITDLLTNTTGAVITATYSITPTVTTGLNCTVLAAVDVVITVEPQPIIVAAQVKTICSGSGVDYHVILLPAGMPLNTEYNWPLPTMSDASVQGTIGASVPESNALTITDILTNTTGANITATYSITPIVSTGLNCTTLPAVDIVITIEPQPTIVPGQVATICSGSNVNYHVSLLPAGLPANTEYSWPAPTMSAGPAQGSAGVNVPEANALTILDVLTNTTGAAITATYSVTPTVNGGLGCTTLAPVDVVITVEPQPIINAGQIKTICSGDGVDYHVSLLPAAMPLNTEYSWAAPTMSAGGPQGSAGVNVPEANALTITDVLTNVTGAPITATYSITPVVSTGLNCTTLPAVDVVITIDPEPVLVAAQSKTICSGDNVAYEILLAPINMPVGTVFNWPDPDGAGPASSGTNVAMGTAGTLHIIDALTNVTGVPILVSYQVTPSTGAGCFGNLLSVDITVDPEPVILGGQIKTICSGDQVDLEILMNPVDLPAGAVFNWPDPDGAGPATGGTNVVANPAGTLHIIDVLTNTTGVAFDITYQITPSGPGPTNCPGTQVDVVITIDPEPVLVAVQTKTICSGDNVDYEILLTPANLPAGTLFNWPDPDGAGPASGGTNVAMGGAGTLHITDALTNTTGAPIVISYQVTPTSGATCDGTLVSVDITVDPEPVLVAAQTKTICGGDNVAYEILLAPLNLPLATVFNWPDPDGPGPATAGVNVAMGAAGTLHITDVLTNTTGASILVNYQITPTGGAGCVGGMVTVGITVDAEPVLVGVQNKTICSGNNVDYEILLTPANLPAGTVFNWPDPDGAGPATGGTNVAMGAPGTLHITDLLTNTTGADILVSYQVTPSSGAGCNGTLVPIDITVAPEPVIVAAQIKTICSGDQVDIEILMTPANMPVATLYNWPDPDGGGPASGGINVAADPAGTLHITDALTNFTGVPFNVTYQITPTSSAPNNCPGTTVDIVVTVDPEPVIISAAAETICSSNSPSIMLAANVVGTNFNWVVTNVNNVTGTLLTDMGSDLTTEFLINTSGLAGSVTYDVTPTGPLPGLCVGAVQTVIITVDPEPVMGSANAETICSGGSPTIALFSNVPLSTFNWVVASVSNVTGTIPGNMGNDLTTEVLANISGAAGFVTYNVTASGPTALTCPGPTQIVTITVDPAPVMTSANSETICSGNTPSINFTSNVVGSTFDWLVVAMSEFEVPGIPDIIGTFVGNSGSVDFSTETLTNFTTGAGTVTYDVTPRGPIGLGCFGITQVVTITVDPGPAGVADAEQECSNVPLNYDIQADNINNGGNGVVGQFTYTVSEITASGIALEPDVVAPTVIPITFNYINTTAIPAIVRYTITPIGFGACTAGTPFDVDFTINPEPVINPQAITICSQIPLTITPTLSNFANVDVNITWTVTNITGVVSGINVNDTDVSDPFPHVLTNTSSGPAVITYAFLATETINNNCASSTEDIIVTVNPEPVGTPTVVAAVCSDILFSLTLDAFVPNLAGNNYTWTVNYNGLAGAGPGAGTLIAEAITNPTSATVNVVYTVIPTSLGGTCMGAAFDLTVPIFAEPRLDPNLSPFPVCSDVPSGIILGVDPGPPPPPSIAALNYDIVSITWAPALIPAGANAAIGNGQPANVLAGDSYTNTSNIAQLAMYDVIPVSADGCKGNVLTITFTVNPAPELSSNLNVIVCNDGVNGIILSTTGTSTPVANYRIVAIDAPGLTADPGNAETVLGPLPIVSANVNVIGADMYNNPTNGILTATYSIVPISGPGCDGPSVDVIMTVEPDIIATPISLNATICSNDMTDITLISPTTPSAGVVSFNVQTTVISGTASGFIPFLSSLPENFQFTDVLVNSGNVDATVRYQITPVAAAAASNNGCTGTFVNIDVVVEPLPQVTPGQFVQVCSGTALNYTISNLNGLGGTMFRWVAAPVVTGGMAGGTARPAASIAPISDTFVNTTGFRQTATYTVTPVGPSANACEGTPVNVTINVDPLPDGTIGVDQLVVCQNGSAILNFNMTVGVAPFDIVYSAFDGTTTTNFPVPNIANSHFIAQSALTVTTTYTLESILDVNGCSVNVAGQSVTVTVENPIADFVLDVNTDCTPLDVTFTNNNIQAGTQYEWNWGDGSPLEITSSPTVVHTFVNNSTISDISYNVTLIAQRTNGTVVCTQSQTEFVTINAGVNLSINTQTTEGCSPLLVSFENNSQGVLVNKWFWREQGTTDENDIKDTFFASFVLSNLTATTKTIEIVYQGDRNGCANEVITEVLVHPEVVADFTVAPSNNIIVTNPTITVTNTSINKNSWVHLWEWGDGDTTTDIDPGAHTYPTFGQYELKLTITDAAGNCTSEKIEVITVDPVLPEVDFTVDITEGCRALTVNFTSISTAVDPNTYSWEFTNERGTLLGTSNLENPSFTFFVAGIINVTLSGSNPLGVIDTETKLALIEVFEIPTASFTLTPETVFLPDQLLFTSNLSALADAFQWDFNGDGDIDSEEFEPRFEYESAGVFNVSLIALNTATTCSDTFNIDKAVTVVEAGTADIPNGFFPGSGNGSVGNPGGPGGAGPPNSVFLPRIKGVRDDGFLMQVFDRWGHLLFESNDKNVGWNGRDNSGRLFPVGVYVYKLELVYVSGQQTTVVGDVTLIR